jgi:NADH:ubiquinone oxidoreductase subunit 6 (subunit J)
MLTVLVTFMIFFFTFVGKFFGLALFNIKFSLLFDLGVPFVACILASCVPALSNPMHALLSLVGVFLATILFYLKSGIEFIGLVTLIVYVGAVAILFLFVIMLLNVKSLTTNSILIKYRLQYVLLSFGLGLAAYLFINLVYPLSTVPAPIAVTSAKVPLTLPGYFFTEIYHTVLYRKADVNAIAGLYTTHAVLF